jgi:hypothetical protein
MFKSDSHQLHRELNAVKNCRAKPTAVIGQIETPSGGENDCHVPLAPEGGGSLPTQLALTGVRTIWSQAHSCYM